MRFRRSRRSGRRRFVRRRGSFKFKRRGRTGKRLKIGFRM